MQVHGDVRIRAPREEVYWFLTDAESVSRCTPGVESFEIVEPGRRFRAQGAMGLGGGHVRFSSDVELTELVPPERASMKMSCTVRGRAVEIGSNMILASGSDGLTVMRWTARVRIPGTIGGLAGWLIRPFARKFTRDLVACLKRTIEEKSGRVVSHTP